MLEQVHSLCKVVNYLLLRSIIRVAVGIQRGDTCAMFAPFVLPKALIVALVVLPINIHVCQKVRCARSLQDGGNVLILTVWVTVRIVRAVAMVRPTPLSVEARRTRGHHVYHKPCTVQWSAGPVAGSVSQNCVWSNCPPGELKQHVFCTVVVL